jgi:two-component system chemotaxis sensor kinase CheA
MIVDDSASVRQVVGITLRGAGYDVIEGSDGADALRKLDGRKVNLIISDVIPLDRVLECVELPPSSRRRDYMDLRGELLGLVRLRSLLSEPGEPVRRESVVVVENAGMKAGLVVSQLKGELQTVIKPLGPLFSCAEGIGGSTILGNGEVALIVDVPMLVRRALDLQKRSNLSA